MHLPFHLINRALSCFPAETAHDFALTMLSLGFGPHCKTEEWKHLEMECAGLHFSNPLMLAAGLDKNARAPGAFLKMGFSAIECGAVTPLAQYGQKKPRLFRLKEDQALINRMGFNNDGLKKISERLETYQKSSPYKGFSILQKEKREFLASYPKKTGGLTTSKNKVSQSDDLATQNLCSLQKPLGHIGINMGANKESTDRIHDYIQILQGFWFLADYFSINISSPNTPGLRDLQSQDYLSELLERIAQARRSLILASAELAGQTLDQKLQSQPEFSLERNTSKERHGVLPENSINRAQNISVKGYGEASIPENSFPLQAQQLQVGREENIQNSKPLPVSVQKATFYNPPLFLKLSPDIDDFAIEPIAETAYAFGIDGLIISNTTLERSPTLKSKEAFQKGGLSGAPLFGKSTRLLRAFYTLTQGRMALIGAGGVDSGAAAYAKIRSGASLVQIYTALIYQGPGLIPKILQDLSERLKADGFKTVSEAVGKF